MSEVKPLLTKEKILLDYKDIFEGLGNIGKASLTVDPEVTPVHHALRRIAVTYRLDQQHGGRCQTREDQNLPGLQRSK